MVAFHGLLCLLNNEVEVVWDFDEKLKVDSTLFIFWMVELEKRREIQKEKHQKETYILFS